MNTLIFTFFSGVFGFLRWPAWAPLAAAMAATALYAYGLWWEFARWYIEDRVAGMFPSMLVMAYVAYFIGRAIANRLEAKGTNSKQKN
jgi:hypothetical protein